MPPQTIDSAAPVNYVRSERARHLRITVRPDLEVRVTVPPRASAQEAQQFVAAKQDWINTHLARLARQRQRQREMMPPDLSKIDMLKAQEGIFDRLNAFSRQHRLPYRRAAFRCQKTKWASCSAHNNISLNINMIFLPRHLQDYLLLHELAHVRHKNHSPAFWAELDRLCGGAARAMACELKQHSMVLSR